MERHEELLGACKMAIRAFNVERIDPIMAFSAIEKLQSTIAKAEGK